MGCTIFKSECPFAEVSLIPSWTSSVSLTPFGGDDDADILLTHAKGDTPVGTHEQVRADLGGCMSEG